MRLGSTSVMAFDPFIIVSLAITICLIVMFVWYLSRQAKYQISNTYLTLTVLFTGIGNLPYAIGLDIPFQEVGLSLMILGFLTFYLYFQSLLRARPSFLGYSVIVGLLAINTFLTFIVIQILLAPNPLNGDTNELVWYKLMPLNQQIWSLSGVFVFIQPLISHSSLYRKTHYKPLLIETGAVLVLLAGRISMFIRDFILSWYDPFYAFFGALGLILTVAGLIVLLGNYIKNPQYVYLLPQPLRSIMIYNSAGLMIYGKRLLVTDYSREEESQDMLITGAFQAVASLVKETLGAKADLSRIDAGDYQVLLTALPNNVGKVAVISKGVSQALIKLIARFVARLPKEVLDMLQQTGFETTGIQKVLDQCVTSAFPYVQISER